MNIVAGLRGAALLAVLVLMPLISAAQQYDTYVGSSFGKLKVTMKDDGALVGTFDKGGKINAPLMKDKNGWEGIWVAEEAPKECDTEKSGSSYWGNLYVTIAESGRVLTGKWGYCDADPDVTFKAELEAK
jgi:hypothetical protein